MNFKTARLWVFCLAALLYGATVPMAQALERRSETARMASGDRKMRLAGQYDKAGCDWPNMDAEGAAIVLYPDPLGRQYNPVTIAQVALGCYHSWLRFRRPDFRRRYLDQIKWLTTKFVSLGPDFAAYEYHFPWSYGLKPGWRSALAQAQAISALIRYHYDTHDNSVLPLIRRLKNLMMLPVDRGGAAAISPEGGLWLEEFTTTPPSYVLNGFISAFFGLYEFSRLFPKDTDARRDVERAISSLKASLPEYDSGDWTFLDRMTTPKPKADDGYAAGYLSQLRTLFEITGDPLFRDVGLRWASFFYDVNFQNGGNMPAVDNGEHVLKETIKPLLSQNLLRNNVEVVHATPAQEGFGVDQLFDLDLNTYFAPAVFGSTEIHLKLPRPALADALTIKLYNAKIYPKTLHIFVKEQGRTELNEVSHIRANERRYISYYFKPLVVEEIRLVADDFEGQDRLVIEDLALGKANKILAGISEFGSFRTDAFQLNAESFKIALAAPRQSKGQIKVIYRHAREVADLDLAPWEWDFIRSI